MNDEELIDLAVRLGTMQRCVRLSNLAKTAATCWSPTLRAKAWKKILTMAYKPVDRGYEDVEVVTSVEFTSDGQLVVHKKSMRFAKTAILEPTP